MMHYFLAALGALITGTAMVSDNGIALICGTIWLSTACVCMAIQKLGEKYGR